MPSSAESRAPWRTQNRPTRRPAGRPEPEAQRQAAIDQHSKNSRGQRDQVGQVGPRQQDPERLRAQDARARRQPPAGGRARTTRALPEPRQHSVPVPAGGHSARMTPAARRALAARSSSVVQHGGVRRAGPRRGGPARRLARQQEPVGRARRAQHALRARAARPAARRRRDSSARASRNAAPARAPRRPAAAAGRARSSTAGWSRRRASTCRDRARHSRPSASTPESCVWHTRESARARPTAMVWLVNGQSSHCRTPTTAPERQRRSRAEVCTARRRAAASRCGARAAPARAKSRNDRQPQQLGHASAGRGPAQLIGRRRRQPAAGAGRPGPGCAPPGRTGRRTARGTTSGTLHVAGSRRPPACVRSAVGGAEQVVPAAEDDAEVGVVLRRVRRVVHAVVARAHQDAPEHRAVVHVDVEVREAPAGCPAAGYGIQVTSRWPSISMRHRLHGAEHASCRPSGRGTWRAA